MRAYSIYDLPSQVFSKIYLRWGFLQVELENTSQHLATCVLQRRAVSLQKASVRD